jgi:tetratricopeptide (TPR) repeat protein
VLLTSCSRGPAPGTAALPTGHSTAVAPTATSDSNSRAASVPSVSGDSSAPSVAPEEDERLPAPLADRLARGSGEASDLALAEGDSAYAADELAKAERAYRRALSLAPRDPAPRVGLVRVALLRSELSQGYAVAPDDARVRSWLKDLDGALGLDPDYAPALLERGRLLLMLGDAEAARGVLERAVALLPGHAEAESALGVALIARGDSEGAVKRFRRASRLDPDNPDRLTNLGTAYMMLGRVGEAISA